MGGIVPKKMTPHPPEWVPPTHRFYDWKSPEHCTLESTGMPPPPTAPHPHIPNQDMTYLVSYGPDEFRIHGESLKGFELKEAIQRHNGQSSHTLNLYNGRSEHPLEDTAEVDSTTTIYALADNDTTHTFTVGPCFAVFRGHANAGANTGTKTWPREVIDQETDLYPSAGEFSIDGWESGWVKKTSIKSKAFGETPTPVDITWTLDDETTVEYQGSLSNPPPNLGWITPDYGRSSRWATCRI